MTLIHDSTSIITSAAEKSEVKGGAKCDGQTDMADVINNDIF